MLSLFALIVLLIPMLIIAVIVKLTSLGSVLYKQERLGKDGVSFEIIKFRSMYADAENNGAQWSDGENAGFSTGKPWFYVNDNYTEINVASQEDDPDSLLNFYRKLLKFRKENPIAIYGDYQELLPNDKNLYVYLRSYEDKKMLVICSFTRDAVRFDAPESLKISKAALVLNNYEHNFVISEGFTTRPYEMRVYLFA